MVTVIVPSYNPDEKLVKTVDGLLEYGFTDVLVVDDGSAEDKKVFFKEVAAKPGVTVIHHYVNRGKGRAMKTAFKYCLKNRPGIDGVITVDGDGQHLPKDIAACVYSMSGHKDDIILGVRDFSRPEVPFKSKFGNNLTSFIFRLCGIKITDTQTGLRAIPYEHLKDMLRIKGERYEYETEQLLVFKKLGIGVHEVTIDTVYIDDNESSHFNPVKDSIRIYKVIFKFIGRELFGKRK